MLASLALIAIVTQNQVALRAAPRESAPRQAVLAAGDSLEIRGEKGDYLYVYDHRRERGGYVRATQLRRHSLQAEDAGELLAIVRFLRDTPGAEGLGIGYAAAYLKAAPAQAIDGEPFAALGAMAERLADRASAPQRQNLDAGLSAQLEVAAAYGVVMKSHERDGRMQMCYDGEAHRRVLALPASETLRAEAALALTRHDCLAPDMPPLERTATDQWRAEVLDRVAPRELPPLLKNRLRLRKAGVWAAIAHQRARQNAEDTTAIRSAAQRAIDELAAIDKNELGEDDAASYSEAAIRVSASRWAAEILPATAANARHVRLDTLAGAPGETCVRLVDARNPAAPPLVSRCTYGIVWRNSAAIHPQGSAVALAVQPLPGWRELWVFRKGENGWSVDALPPAAAAPELGYAEFAGWAPGGQKLLTVREARVDGRYQRRFEVLRLSDLGRDKQADTPAKLADFKRGQDANWKRGTLSLR